MSMSLQDYVDISKEINHLREARDLLREVQFAILKCDGLSYELEDKINDYFDNNREVMV